MPRRILRTLPVALLLLVSLVPHGTRAATDAGWKVLAPVHTPPILYQPAGIALDPAGRLFVADDILTAYYADAVVEIVPNGDPRFWGGRGQAPGEFLNAAGVALDASGALYVTNIDSMYPRSSCIEKLDSP